MDAIAAAARLALLGTSAELAVPFEELKPEIRERWRWVVDVAQKPVYAERDALRVGWANSHKAEEECERLRAAFAHIQPARPKGLPTNEDVARVLRECNSMTTDARAEAILAALAPYLREPTGWELAMHRDELDLYRWVTEPGGGYSYAAQQTLDLCRSRIRPVFECQECAARHEAMIKPQPEVQCAGCVKWEAYGVKMEDTARVLAKRIDAVRTALEGE